EDLADVSVWIDGALSKKRLDGLPMALDPGEHVLRFEVAGGGSVEQRVVLRAGEQGRRIAVAMPPSEQAQASTPEPARPTPAAKPPAPAQTPAPRSLPLVTIVCGSVAVAGLGSFATFAILGKTLEKKRASSCSPSCTDDELAPVRRDYLVADISLGVALVS